MPATRVDPTARQTHAFATYCVAGRRKGAAHQFGVSETTAAQVNDLFGRREAAGRLGAARAPGQLLTPGLLGIRRIELGRRWPTTEDEQAASLTEGP